MRKIVEGALVSVKSIEGEKAFINIEEAERILKFASEDEYVPTIYLIGCDCAFLTLENLPTIKSHKELLCYVKGRVEEFQTEEDLRGLDWDNQINCRNSIRAQLIRIGRPVTQSELGFSASLSYGWNPKEISSMYVDLQWTIRLIYQSGETGTYNEAMMAGHMFLHQALEILCKLEIIRN